MPEAKEKEKKSNGAEQIIQDMTLPQLLSTVTRGMLEGSMSELTCRQNLRLWYTTQTIDDRKEFAKKFRKTLETYKLIGEMMYQESVGTTAGDLA